MDEFFDQCPAMVQNQIKDIIKNSDFENEEQAVEMMAKAWIEKRDIFDKRIEMLYMEETDSFSKDDKRSALILTYSGSLMSIGPLIDGIRIVEYASIDQRGNVPKTVSTPDSKLANDIKIDKPVEFEKGPIKISSPVFKIAIFDEDMDIDKIMENLNKVTEILRDEFANINQTLIIE